MDYDAYSSFVAVDVEARRPLFTVGLIAGTQYADADDEPPRRFRHGLEVLKRAVAFWDTSALVAPVSMVVHLGDALATEAGAAPPAALAAHREVAGRSAAAHAWHVAVGPHDLAALGAAGVGALAPLRPLPPAAAYYAVSSSAGWRCLILDAFDISLLGCHRGSAGHAAALSKLMRENPAVAAAGAGVDPLAVADPLAGLHGHARRFGPRGGGLSEGQLGWVREQLSLAEEAGERVLVFCHLGCLRDGCAAEGLLFNCDEAKAVIDSFAGTVAAWVSGGDPAGGYARDGHGVHHVTLASAAHCLVNQDAFGALQVHDGHMTLRMVGTAPSSASRPQGWPDTLALPRSGKLVAAPPAGAGFVFLLVSLWMSVLQAIMVPVAPLLRMLTDDSGQTDRQPDRPREAAGREGGGGSVALGRIPSAAAPPPPVQATPPPPPPRAVPGAPPPAAAAPGEAEAQGTLV
jgi:hypothetical protein